MTILKKSAAIANNRLGKLDDRRMELIAKACDEILEGKLDGHFPLPYGRPEAEPSRT